MFGPFSKTITHSLHSFQQAGPVAQLVADGLHVHVHRSFPRAVRRAARRCQFPPLEDSAGFAGQGPQQAEFGRRQTEVAAVQGGGETPPVQLQAVSDDSIIGPAGRLNPGQQGAETVLKIVPPLVSQGRAVKQIGMPSVCSAFRRQQEYGQSARLQAADFAAHVQGIGIRQVRVQQDKIRLSRGRASHAGATVGGREHAATGNPQAGLQPFLELPGLPDN
jgi:hypothetical protein